VFFYCSKKSLTLFNCSPQPLLLLFKPNRSSVHNVVQAHFFVKITGWMILFAQIAFCSGLLIENDLLNTFVNVLDRFWEKFEAILRGFGTQIQRK